MPTRAPQAAERVVVRLTGSPQAMIHGFYIADGNRSEFSATLPATLEIHGISILAYAKKSTADEVRAEVKAGRGSMMFKLMAGDDKAALLQLADGMSGTYAPAGALAAPVHNALIVIKPYWYEGTWVFDDAATGLTREPFVTGIPEIIDTIVKDIPNARQGFRLTASENPFPGHQQKLLWLRAESGGNYYQLDGSKMEGWLCPAMFHYFDHTPKALYVKAEALEK